MHVHYRLHRVRTSVMKRGGDPVSVTARAASLLVAFLVVAGLVTFVALYYLARLRLRPSRFVVPQA